MPHPRYLVPLATALLLTMTIAAPLAAGESAVIDVFPQGVPDESLQLSEEAAQKAASRADAERIAYVEKPTLHVYEPQGDAKNGAAVIVCPGGGYNILAWPKEGVELAEWFNSLGVTAFVLKYRVPRRGDVPEKAPLQDLQRSIRLVRSQAGKWHIDPNRIGVLGFSAGGHLTLSAGTRWQNAPESDPELKKISARPDFICPIYAAYLGEDYSDKMDAPLSSKWNLTRETPPTFLAVTADDAGRGRHAALLFAKLLELKVPAELHVYAEGGHGYGIRPSKSPAATWHLRLGEWLAGSGLLSKRDPAG